MEVKDYDVVLRFDGSHGLKEQDWDEQYVEEEQDGGGLWENGSWVGRLELENERRRDSQIWSLRFDSDNYQILHQQIRSLYKKNLYQVELSLSVNNTFIS